MSLLSDTPFVWGSYPPVKRPIVMQPDKTREGRISASSKLPTVWRPRLPGSTKGRALTLPAVARELAARHQAAPDAEALREAAAQGKIPAMRDPASGQWTVLACNMPDVTRHFRLHKQNAWHAS
jgi:hypothetical protein